MTKFLTAVSALALGLAMSSAALADDAEAFGSGNDTATQTNGNSADQTNGNQLLSNNDNNGNDSSNNSNQDNGNTNDSNNDGNAIASGNTVASHNDLSENLNISGNDVSEGNNRNNDQSENLAIVGNSLASNNDNSVDVDVDVDNSVSVEDTAIGVQSLSAEVSDVGARSTALGLLALANNETGTGDATVRGSAFSGLTGIATVSQDTGLGSINQAATQVNANASLNFGE